MAEGYPKDWSLVHLVVSPNANEIHAVGGDRDSITGDSPYPGLERILERIRKAEAVLAEARTEATRRMARAERYRMAMETADRLIDIGRWDLAAEHLTDALAAKGEEVGRE